MIVTLAGHVDHGKTSLVNAITGVVTDRLKEEAERGLTINLGFAYLQQAQQTLGFVDVPGHQKFIHNMVAGVSAHQCALLVVAADDGPMPQTIEHLQIMQVLGLKQGVIAITKVDRVEPARVAEVETLVRELTANSFLADAPKVKVCSHDGTGISELVAEINLLAETTTNIAPASPRLAIDRAFTLKGQGVVVTGTLHCGTLKVDDELFLFPKGQQVRIRSMHVQDANASIANTGDRCALNISGSNVTLADVGRGQWLMANPPTAHRRLVAQFELLDNFPRPLKHWTAVHLYQGTSHSLAQLALLEHTQLNPGESGLVELNCNLPLNAKRGDRLVLRDFGQDQTLGGATILSNASWTGRRRAPERLQQIYRDQTGSTEQHFAWGLDQGGLALSDFQQLWDLSQTQVDALVAENSCVVHDGRAVSEAHLTSWSDAIIATLEQSTTPDGLNKAELQTALPQLQPADLTLGLWHLSGAKKIKVTGGRHQLPGSTVQLNDAEAKLLTLLTKHLDSDQPPSLGDISKASGTNLDAIKRGAKPLAAKGELFLVGDNRAFLPARFLALANLAIKLDNFSVKDFRDASGLGRNIVIDVLERMDAKGFTRRDGNARRVVGDLSLFNR